MYAETYLIIAAFAVAAFVFAVLGMRTEHDAPTTPAPAHPAQMKKAA